MSQTAEDHCNRSWCRNESMRMTMCTV